MAVPKAGYPNNWKNFCSIAPGFGTELFGFVKPIADVNRFAARFRLASSFRSLNLEDYSEATEAGYAALCRVLFVYSAFEAFLEITGNTQQSIGPDLENSGAATLLTNIRAADSENTFYNFIHERVNQRHKTELQNYFNQDPCNIAYLASAIRHIFAHGWLTPNAAGLNPSVAEQVCSEISNFLISFMDSQFNARVDAAISELTDS